MRVIFSAALLATVALPFGAQAQTAHEAAGAGAGLATGAVAGAIVGGPVGAAIGGALGALARGGRLRPPSARGLAKYGMPRAPFGHYLGSGGGCASRPRALS